MSHLHRLFAALAVITTFLVYVSAIPNTLTYTYERHRSNNDSSNSTSGIIAKNGSANSCSSGYTSCEYFGCIKGTDCPAICSERTTSTLCIFNVNGKGCRWSSNTCVQDIQCPITDSGECPEGCQGCGPFQCIVKGLTCPTLCENRNQDTCSTGNMTNGITCVWNNDQCVLWDAVNVMPLAENQVVAREYGGTGNTEDTGKDDTNSGSEEDTGDNGKDSDKGGGDGDKKEEEDDDEVEEVCDDGGDNEDGDDDEVEEVCDDSGDGDEEDDEIEEVCDDKDSEDKDKDKEGEDDDDEEEVCDDEDEDDKDDDKDSDEDDDEDEVCDDEDDDGGESDSDSDDENNEGDDDEVCEDDDDDNDDDGDEDSDGDDDDDDCEDDGEEEDDSDDDDKDGDKGQNTRPSKSASSDSSKASPTDSTSTSQTLDNESGSKSIGTGALVGIVLLVLGIIGLISWGGLFFATRRKREFNSASNAQARSLPTYVPSQRSGTSTLNLSYSGPAGGNRAQAPDIQGRRDTHMSNLMN